MVLKCITLGEKLRESTYRHQQVCFRLMFRPLSRGLPLEEDLGIKVETSDQKQTCWCLWVHSLRAKFLVGDAWIKGKKEKHKEVSTDRVERKLGGRQFTSFVTFCMVFVRRQCTYCSTVLENIGADLRSLPKWWKWPRRKWESWGWLLLVSRVIRKRNWCCLPQLRVFLVETSQRRLEWLKLHIHGQLWDQFSATWIIMKST